ncbi:hypothetical protein [Siphonobacter sp. SORGH_AS_1065]|uniref:hypothetical protein n=1 Tax=Siphonobacter sp. SORGH_AS_1065 TaxID=3041795 RepID=UPI00277E108B|nr:hypothetical protein [Siphonobacter sp. SORGH_AS_1065]MDQ1089552.1 hypothetical protein [Siphonobacter sp. SORGH_AS_1065]
MMPAYEWRSDPRINIRGYPYSTPPGLWSQMIIHKKAPKTSFGGFFIENADPH